MEASGVRRKSDPLGNLVNGERFFGIPQQSDDVRATTPMAPASGGSIKDWVFNFYGH